MPEELPDQSVGAPEATQTPEPTVDYEKRWKDTHANWNTLNEQMSRFKQDPNAVIEFIRETHPDLLADTDEEDDEPDYDDPDDRIAPLSQKLGQFEQWQQQVEAERAEQRFNRDLKTELGDETVPAKVNDWIKSRTATLGNTPQALKQAVEEYREFAGEIRGPTRKPAPTPPAPGTAGEAKRDPRSREQRRARMAASIEAARQE
jgi:hypothetical protein